jgi:putative tricarboxylic transport membrane protein
MMVIAAVAMFDVRASALPDPTGTWPGGLGPGFYPFWSAFTVFAAAAWVAYRALTRPQTTEGVFADRKSVMSVVTLGAPMVAAVALLSPLGLYIVSGAYMGFFAWAIGRYRLWWVIAIAIAVPLLIYLAFEVGFRVPLPKSMFRDTIGF